jgi:hypothetical protein
MATQNGAGISLERSFATVRESFITENNAQQNGGGLRTSLGSELLLDSTTIAGNTAQLDGGGIFSVGRLLAQNSTIGNNTAAGGSGGGIAGTENAVLIALRNCTVAGNKAVSTAEASALGTPRSS